jgi:hypothetical protein
VTTPRAIAPALPATRLAGLIAAEEYADRVLATRRANLIGYWPLWEPSGVVATDISGNGRNGAHTGVTLGQPGIGDGRTCPLYDSTTDYTNIYSAGLAGAFNSAEGTIAIWAKIPAGVWVDGQTRVLMGLRVDANNLVLITRTSVNNQLLMRYTAGGTISGNTVSFSSLSWFHAAITWSKSADQMIRYINGAQTGTISNGLGVWAGALSSTQCNIGALNTTTAQVLNGYLAHAALWTAALTPAEIAALAKVA